MQRHRLLHTAMSTLITKSNCNQPMWFRHKARCRQSMSPVPKNPESTKLVPPKCQLFSLLPRPTQHPSAVLRVLKRPPSPPPLPLCQHHAQQSPKISRNILMAEICRMTHFPLVRPAPCRHRVPCRATPLYSRGLSMNPLPSNK